MSYEQIKNRKQFTEFVKKFEDQRTKIKNEQVSQKIGEQQSQQEIFKSTTPIVEAIKQQPRTPVIIQQLPFKEDDQQLAIEDLEEAGGSGNVGSIAQTTIRNILSKGKQNYTTLEVNTGNGYIGETGHISIDKLVNEDRIIFSNDDGKSTAEIPLTIGLLYLLFAPYKYINDNEL